VARFHFPRPTEEPAPNFFVNVRLPSDEDESPPMPLPQSRPFPTWAI